MNHNRIKWQWLVRPLLDLGNGGGLSRLSYFLLDFLEFKYYMGAYNRS
uniref:Uncharacterized protein n=1 Tax=Arundo donax TaxID=35708 RepID=A0A0A9C5K0_ARUDO